MEDSVQLRWVILFLSEPQSLTYKYCGLIEIEVAYTYDHIEAQLSNVSAFKGPLLNEAHLLQYDNLLPGTCALAGGTAAHVV